MRSTVIPAQITTVEDRIAGNLNLTQILLLIAPAFITAVVYIIIPQQMAFSLPKVILISLFSTISITLAIRIRARLILDWIVVISSYLMRPRLFVYNKNTSTSRFIETQTKTTGKLIKDNNHTSESIEVLTQEPTIDAVSILRGTQIAFRFTSKGIIATRNI